MKITQYDSTLIHAFFKNAPSQVELFSIFYFKLVLIQHINYLIDCLLNLFSTKDSVSAIPRSNCKR